LFTGLIESVGLVRSISAEAGGVKRIEIQAPGMKRAIRYGDSVAVSGVCLTAVAVRGDCFSAQIMGETLRVSKMGSIRAGDRVNLEASLRPEDGLAGHIVLGHVDEAGRVSKVEMTGGTGKIWVSVSRGVSWGIAAKGSVALDGVSLTVIDSFETEFSVGLIPATLEGTTLSLLEEGHSVNVEIDVLARYVARLSACKAEIFQQDAAGNPGGSLTLERLAQWGWQQGGSRGQAGN
jgi:riboflavin synthase